MEGSWPCLGGQVPCISSGRYPVISIRRAGGGLWSWVAEKLPDVKPLIWDLANMRNTGKQRPRSKVRLFFLSLCKQRQQQPPPPFQLSRQAFWIHHMDPHNRLQGTHKVNESKEGKTESDRGKVNSFAKRSSLVIKFQTKSPVYYGLSFTCCLNMHEFILHEQAQCLHLRCHTQFPSDREKEYPVKIMLPKTRWWFPFFFTGLKPKLYLQLKMWSFLGGVAFISCAV